MTAQRFFILPEQIKDGKVFFAPEESFQMRNVLRLKKGAGVLILDNRGREGEVELVNLSQKGVEGILRREIFHPPPSPPRITLALSVPSHARMDWIIQKGTELGMDRLLLFVSRRANRKGAGDTKRERWKKIAKEAAEQSGRIFLPEIQGILSFTELLTAEGDPSLKIIFWEGENESRLPSLLGKGEAGIPRVLLVIGPEGGFETEEVEAARRAGFIPCGLGGNILRIETAALAALSILQFSLGRMG